MYIAGEISSTFYFCLDEIPERKKKKSRDASVEAVAAPLCTKIPLSQRVRKVLKCHCPSMLDLQFDFDQIFPLPRNPFTFELFLPGCRGSWEEAGSLGSAG